MFKFIKNASLAYLAFGVGIVIGSIIASVVASLLLMATLDASQLERLNEIAEDIKKE